jgi:hypothetical protein
MKLAWWKLGWGFYRDVIEGAGLLGSNPASNPRRQDPKLRNVFTAWHFWSVRFLVALYVKFVSIVQEKTIFKTLWDSPFLATYCNRSSSWYRTWGDLSQYRLNFSAVSLVLIVLDAGLFLRPQYVLHGATQFVSIIMTSHGKLLYNNVGLPVKCLLHLTDFNQNRNVQANFNKSLNMKFHENLSGGRRFVLCGLAGVTKLTVSFHTCISSASKIFILIFWLKFNARSLPGSHVVCLGFFRIFPAIGSTRIHN